MPFHYMHIYNIQKQTVLWMSAYSKPAEGAKAFFFFFKYTIPLNFLVLIVNCVNCVFIVSFSPKRKKPWGFRAGPQVSVHSFDMREGWDNKTVLKWLNCVFVILSCVCVLVDGKWTGEWTVVKGGGAGVLGIPSCVPCDALRWHEKPAVWQISHQTYNTGEE